MRKNQKNNEQKVNERSLKTDSEMMESAKMEPRKNSEKAIDEVDYPPELAEFLGEVLKSLHQTMGIPKNKGIPTATLKEFYEKLLDGYDVEKLTYELGCEKLFGLKSKKGIKKMPLIDEEPDAEDEIDDDFGEDDGGDDDFLTDEMLENIDWTTLPEDQYGNRVLAKFALNATSTQPIGVVEQLIQVKIDEETINNHVVIIVDIPFFNRMPIEEASSSPQYIEGHACFIMNQTEAFQICPETNDELSELLDRCGVSDGRLKFDSNEDVLQTIEKTFEEGNVANGDVGIRSNGYYEDTMEYWYNEEIYHEKDVIWFGVPKPVYKTDNGDDVVIANMDCFSDIYTSCDITQFKNVKVANHRRVLTKEEEFEVQVYGKKREFFETLLENEEVWHIATEYAKTQKTYGFCAVCLNGKFNMPVENFYNHHTGACDSLAVMFNVVSCTPIHHQLVAVLVADIGNIQLQTAIRYQNGAVFDWYKRFNQEIAAYQLKKPNFDPFADPYDDPSNAYEEGE